MKLKLILISLFTVVIAAGCTEKTTKEIAKTKATEKKDNQQPDKTALSSKEGSLTIEGDRVIIPNFKIEVNLSDKAVELLQKNKESIIASLFFYGDVRDENSLPEDIKKELGPNGLKLMVFDMEKIDVTQSNELEITNLSFPKKLYDALASKDIYVNINVFSGRRTFKDNILDMEFYDSKLNEIISHSSFINLNGRLMTEDKD
ncbi:hypothetical protein MP478_01685 [Chryseobacterium sp. WG14]|uniref:hypothetical protein n=1 Tax=unclassified Chryseobacterium TaxID=2593645 RepID=UPI00211DE975|nr:MULTISPECIES: hypothetical protein [unclassified Chryseobacterium]MCQ9634249.1 hypothetical protein [Chryseobacterium sp. WG23]MCQ9638084.1 hypothetical protein [Chryseobacterium sp. WG14]